MRQDIPLIGPFLNRLIGSRNDRFVKKYLQRVEAIGDMEVGIRKLTDAQIKAKVIELRQKLDAGTSVDVLMTEAFAVAREAMDRSVGLRNIFSPQHREKFEPGRLSASGRAEYERILAEADALVPAAPEGEFLGCNDPLHGYLSVEVPISLYEEVRSVYTESRPPFRARPFDVQLIGAMVLYQGRISEMKTGEGKTIVAPLACYLACVERIKVHVVTVNDYLVQRDRDWTFPFFHALGLTVGAIHPQHMQGEDTKRQMYQCDIVYGTTAEFGFDYLRDNMKRSVDQQVQRRRQFAIVDEVDSILIDEARTPLIISGSAHDDKPRYDVADQLARHLTSKQKPWQEADDKLEAAKRLVKGLEGDIRNVRDQAKVPELKKRLAEAQVNTPKLEAERAKSTQYYEVQLERKSAHLTHDGIAEAQRVAGRGSFYVGENMDLPHLLEQSLRAHVVFLRDRDYIVAPSENPHTGRMEPSIVIVDVNTGRPMVGRSWSDGLHQACEAKEGVPIKQENQTVATITIQNFFKMYKRLAGMTGTADTEAQEFYDIYKLDVVSIPTNRKVTRRDFDDMVFLSEKDKWEFIVDEVKAFHDVGRPVLVGTTSVENSEMLGQMLTRRHGIKHEVLNAKQHEREAHIVENAGQLGQVMIATNMAGRGTDIKLGAVTREQLLDHWLKRGICPREVTVESSEAELREGVYRKMGPGELDLPKREVEQMPFAELELKLLRYWAEKHTWLQTKEVERMDAEGLRDALDKHGRFLVHRIRWFGTIEDMGGLHVVGTERHESRRIDNQLRGRCGRQGDKGSSRFFISLEDELMKLFAGETTMRILSRLGMKEGDAIEHPMLSKSVERAQRKVEERNFQYRKHILDYDEVMEHQRQKFYGLRQRVLEGRDMRGLLFDYINDSVRDAAVDFLDPTYAAKCASEFARQKTDCTVAQSRLRGLDSNEMIERIRSEAKEEMRNSIDITLGEYLPDLERDTDRKQVESDLSGLATWSRDKFGVQFTEAELEGMGDGVRFNVLEKLTAAADAQIDATDLSGVETYLAEYYGAEQLAKWVRDKFDIEVKASEIAKAQGEGKGQVEKVIMKQAEELYRKREIEYPVDFAMEMTMALMRQSPQAATGHLLNWANTRFRIGWTEEKIKTTPPAKAREELVKASEAFVREGRIDAEVAKATALKTDGELQGYFSERFGIDLPESMRRLEGQERADAVRSKVEGQLRSELVMLERTMLIDTFDDQWKGHLYAMDQLKDGINFRSLAQRDPKIEYKREGARMFAEMMVTLRDRVTDYVFKARLSPNVSAMPQPGTIAPGGFGAMNRPAMAPPAAGGASGRDPYYSSPTQSPPRAAGPGTIAGVGFDPRRQPPGNQPGNPAGPPPTA